MKRIVPTLRSVASVLAGYVLLAATNMAFVMLFFVPPTPGWSSPGIFAVATPYTFLCGFLTGYLVEKIAGRRRPLHAAIVASLMGAVIVVSLIINVAAEPTWYRLEYLILMVLSTVLGGRFTSLRRSS